MTVLVTTANGMFGRAVVRQLVASGVAVRAMVRNRAKFDEAHPGVEVVEADLDRPATLPAVLDGVESMFLASPMDERLADRETAVIEAAERAGVARAVRIGGAVRHAGDRLSALHSQASARLQASSLAWTFVSPNSVMETSFLGHAPVIKGWGVLSGISGHGRIGLVALQDVVEVTAKVLAESGHGGRNYEITGPEALDLYQVAEVFTRVLGKPVTYQDLSEAELKAMLAPAMRMSDAELDMNVLCHLRCWRDGKADLVTDTYRALTGRAPTSLEAWITQNRALFT